MTENTTSNNRWHRHPAVLLIVLVACMAVSPCSAADLPANPIPGTMHVTIDTVNGGGYYLKYDGGGLNSLHMTTSTTDRYGQLTTTSMKTGTFYISDTGGRGFCNDIILMVAVRKPEEGDEPLPDDFAIRLRSSGYQWEPTGVVNMPPATEDVTYVTGAADEVLTLSSLRYGPQKWKPAGNNDPMNYPIYGDQDITSSEEFYICFVDLKAGVLGEYVGLPALTDNGMVKVEYAITNLDSGLVAFNTYGWCDEDQSNQGAGISWTNKITGAGASGYVVDIVGAGGGEGGSSGRLSYDSDDTGFPGGWTPDVGNLNISSVPAGAKVYLDGADSGEVTNHSFVDVPAGDYRVYLAYDGYAPTEPKTIRVKAGYVTEERFVLEKGTGSCFVSSVPAGADIFVDGTDTLWHTDSVVNEIEAGTHTVTVYHDGYAPQSADVTIVMGEESAVSFVFGAAGEDTPSADAPTPSPVSVVPEKTPAVTETAGAGVPSAAVEARDSGDDGFIGSLFRFVTGLFSAGGEDLDAPPAAVSGPSDSANLPPSSAPGSTPAPLPEHPGTNPGTNPGISVPDAGGREPSGSPVVSAATGTGGLYVTSYPDNLAITLDGAPADASTPEYFYGLKEGRHTVQVSYTDVDSVKTAQKTVSVSAGGDTYVKLEPARYSRAFPVTVQSKEFRDAEFRVAGEDPAYPFPSKVNLDSGGTYVTVEDDGTYYSFPTGHPEENAVLIIASPDEGVSVGTVRVTSTPAGADVFVDGHRTGLQTPCTVDGVADGLHLIRVTKGGYYPGQREVHAVNTAGPDDAEVDFLLDEYPYGTLFLDSTPQGAMVYLEGEYTGVTTPHTFTFMPIGSYDVAVMHNRTVFSEGEVTVRPLAMSGVTVYNLTLDM